MGANKNGQRIMRSVKGTVRMSKKEARRPEPSCFFVWARQDLNPRPSGYENVANFEIPFFL